MPETAIKIQIYGQNLKSHGRNYEGELDLLNLIFHSFKNVSELVENSKIDNKKTKF
jgi:hypothetical protein